MSVGYYRGTVADLRARDIGAVVTVYTANTKITGVLQGIQIHTDQIPDQSLAEPDPVMILGRSTATLDVGGWRASGIPTHVVVEWTP